MPKRAINASVATRQSGSRARAPEYDFSHEPRETSGQANAKNYFHRRYRIPSITYEVGDEADRDVLEAAAAVFAEEMMRLMLEIRGRIRGQLP